jgi:hypothetical protein
MLNSAIGAELSGDSLQTNPSRDCRNSTNHAPATTFICKGLTSVSPFAFRAVCAHGIPFFGLSVTSRVGRVDDSGRSPVRRTCELLRAAKSNDFAKGRSRNQSLITRVSARSVNCAIDSFPSDLYQYVVHASAPCSNCRRYSGSITVSPSAFACCNDSCQYLK